MQSYRTALRCLIVLLTFNGLDSVSLFRHNSLDGLSELLKKDSRALLIVVGDSAEYDSDSDYDQRKEEDIEDDDAGFQPRDAYNNVLSRDNYQSIFYDILRNGEVVADNDEDGIIEETLIENALRSRCQAKVECEEKCSRSEERKPKKERYCQKSCKAVFDHLLKCPPPGNGKKREEKKKNKKDKCPPATGKTCPPSWDSES